MRPRIDEVDGSLDPVGPQYYHTMEAHDLEAATSRPQTKNYVQLSYRVRMMAPWSFVLPE